MKIAMKLNDFDEKQWHQGYRYFGLKIATSTGDSAKKWWFGPLFLAIVETMALGLRRNILQRKRVSRRQITSPGAFIANMG